jgi:hypothetical protein
MNNLKKNTADVNILNVPFHAVRDTQTVRFLCILATDLESIITDILRTSRYCKGGGDLKASIFSCFFGLTSYITKKLICLNYKEQ